MKFLILNYAYATLWGGTGKGMKMSKCAWKAMHQVELSAEPVFLSFFLIVYEKKEKSAKWTVIHYSRNCVKAL